MGLIDFNETLYLKLINNLNKLNEIGILPTIGKDWSSAAVDECCNS